MNKNNTTKPKSIPKKGSTCTEFCKCKHENTWASSLHSKQKLSKPVINSSHRHLHCMEQLSKLKLNAVPDNENAAVASSSKVFSVNIYIPLRFFHKFFHFRLHKNLILVLFTKCLKI